MTVGKDVQITTTEWVELQYTDIVGRLRGVGVPFNGEGSKVVARVDGSNVGLADIGDSDLILVADTDTFSRIPWRDGWWRAISNLYTDESTKHPLDPRFCTQRLEEYLRERGLDVFTGVEMEFFLFRDVKVVYSTPTTAGYIIKLVDRSQRGILSNYHLAGDELVEYREILTESLMKFFDIKVVTHHHEVASSQLELSLGASKPTRTSDNIQTTKYVARMVAKKMGLKAVFMPKPLHGENGSGMHIHVSLWRNSRNLFYDPEDPHRLSQLARYFIGGLLHHMRALAALVAPTVNSYRRLVPGFEAPIYAIWGFRNRSAAIRVPIAVSEREVRVEFRPPDPSANPYLAIAAIVAAGLEGIRKSIDPGDPSNMNVYELSRLPKERKLPTSLSEALDELDQNRDFLKPIFSNELIDRYVEIKRREVLEVSSSPSPAEFLAYCDM